MREVFTNAELVVILTAMLRFDGKGVHNEVILTGWTG